MLFRSSCSGGLRPLVAWAPLPSSTTLLPHEAKWGYLPKPSPLLKSFPSSSLLLQVAPKILLLSHRGVSDRSAELRARWRPRCQPPAAAAGTPPGRAGPPSPLGSLHCLRTTIKEQLERASCHRLPSRCGRKGGFQPNSSAQRETESVSMATKPPRPGQLSVI